MLSYGERNGKINWSGFEPKHTIGEEEEEEARLVIEVGFLQQAD
jgi:hypothetical protein